MKKFIYLFEHEFNYIFKYVLLLCGFSIALQGFFIWHARRGINVYTYIPFEEMFIGSGAVIIALISLAGMIGICILSFYSNFNESKSIYTLMALPQDRKNMFFAKILAWFVGFISLVASQLLIGILGYAIFAPTYLKELGPRNIVETRVNNGLFLSFVRSDFYRIVMPLSFEGFLSTFAILISIIFAIYYSLLCIKGMYKREILAIVVVIQLIVVINVLRYRVQLPFEYHNLYISSGILFVITGFYVWDSIKILRKCTFI
ncbi:hypothetical protein [Natranaerovirga pectinivora]|nr:hypothetical protein [Natranaerovirga pectinivora]